MRRALIVLYRKAKLRMSSEILDGFAFFVNPHKLCDPYKHDNVDLRQWKFLRARTESPLVNVKHWIWTCDVNQTLSSAFPSPSLS